MTANGISLLASQKKTFSKCCIDPLRPPDFTGNGASRDVGFEDYLLFADNPTGIWSFTSPNAVSGPLSDYFPIADQLLAKSGLVVGNKGPTGTLAGTYTPTVSSTYNEDTRQLALTLTAD